MTASNTLRLPALVFTLLAAAPALGQGGGGFGIGGGAIGGGFPTLDPELYCPPYVADQGVPGGALEVRPTPQLGALLPLGSDLFVHHVGPGSTAYVGIGTTTPATRLHVEAGDLNIREAALRVRGSASTTDLSLGASSAVPRPHLIDESVSILGGAMPEATFATGDWALRTADPAWGAMLETGVSGAGGQSRLTSGGPNGASLALDHTGKGHLFEAEANAGGGRWEATADGASGSMLLDASRADGDGHLDFEDDAGNAVVRLDANDDLLGTGASLFMDNDAGDTVVECRADGSGGGFMFLDGAGGNSIGLSGGTTSQGASLGMYDEDGLQVLSLASMEPSFGAELRLFDTQGRETIWMQARHPTAAPESFVRFHNHSNAGGPIFTGLELKTPETTKSNALELRSGTGFGIDLIGQTTAGDTGGGILVHQAGVPRFEVYDNVLTLFDLSGAPTIQYDGVTGDKNAIVPTSEGRRKMYCSEAAEVWFEDAGSVRLENGVAEVPLDPVFLQTIAVDEDWPLHVAATARSGPGVWVETLADRLVVRELPGGAGDALVDWRAQARRIGTEGTRLEPAEVTAGD